MKQYPLLQLKEKKCQYLIDAVIAVNQTRELLKASSTHPSVNSLDEKEHKLLNDKINQTKKLCEQTNNLATKIKIIEQSQAGNCEEYSYIALDKFSKLNNDQHTALEIFTLDNGDHAILVIGRRPGSNPNDYKTWGQDAVICDAWAGEVYLAKDIPQKLMDCYHHPTQNHTKRINIIGPFNPNYHGLKLKLSITPTPKITHSTFFHPKNKSNTYFRNKPIRFKHHAKYASHNRAI